MKILISILIVFTLSPAWAQDANSNEPQDFTQRFPNILGNNIFSRYRQPYVEPEHRERKVEIPPAPAEETYYILEGITLETTSAGEKLVALIEYNNQGGSLPKYNIGSQVAEGTIESLSWNSLVYVKPGDDPNQPVRTQVFVGQNLLGQVAQPVSSYNDYDYDYSYNSYNRSSAPSTSSRSSSSGDSSGDADAAAILQQLMERRQQELGR